MTVLSRKTRREEISPMWVMLWPGVASQYVDVSLTVVVVGWVSIVGELCGREAWMAVMRLWEGGEYFLGDGDGGEGEVLTCVGDGEGLLLLRVGGWVPVVFALPLCPFGMGEADLPLELRFLDDCCCYPW